MNKMPKKVINDYIFYKIVCLDDSVELCYVGSTADFNKRRSTHKSNCNNENDKAYNSKIYKTIRENGSWYNFKMIEIGKKEQLTRRQAEQIEEEYRVELKANMNTQRCFRTEEQKQEQTKTHDKKYRDKNKDKIKENIKNYCEENKDKIREQKQNYYEANKDKILEQTQNYRNENREKINEKQNEKVKCECGCNVNKSYLGRHKKLQKHIKLINNKLITN